MATQRKKVRSNFYYIRSEHDLMVGGILNEQSGTTRTSKAIQQKKVSSSVYYISDKIIIRCKHRGNVPA